MAGGCIFDMDGLLFDTERIFQNYWRAIAAERGIVLADSFITEITGTSGKMMNRILKILPHGGRQGNSKRLQRKGSAPSGKECTCQNGSGGNTRTLPHTWYQNRGSQQQSAPADRK